MCKVTICISDLEPGTSPDGVTPDLSNLEIKIDAEGGSTMERIVAAGFVGSINAHREALLKISSLFNVQGAGDWNGTPEKH